MEDEDDGSRKSVCVRGRYPGEKELEEGRNRDKSWPLQRRREGRDRKWKS